ncbi:hypothetical protein KC332_g4287 [Hortaea werneckii]|uniref:BTB domain-containing protein n=2 Tax=Hortaea werneckii TaxID=91943 RepID=A0A3M7IYZ6_HORWE|nr:hypothetical protein KC358_g4381 [Hortaea werneckii]OTA27969.1 hypothetical protein BTJ68_09771 [Hortaea werneckii EXF-2000]KAI6847132.1 hypothetical protein KC350_g3588 [Hortaea werneckii]KAI6930805.1 hypothetical protein KC348_g7475 [Hortaea werneckii]KAI6935577.1 hypothetical protein KC341_g6839 [Hortaea werneckii]
MANKATESAEPDFAEALTNDRFIKVYVGEGPPFLVQQLLLESLSYYFARALQRDRFSEGIHGELRIEGDDRRTWQVLLHWLFKGMLPCQVKDDPDLLIDLWIVGDKYDVDALQNDAMYALLEYLDTTLDDITLPLATMKDGIDRTTPGTVLRKVLAEEILRATCCDRSASSVDFIPWDAGGLASDLLQASDACDQHGWSYLLNRFDQTSMRWQDSMLPGGRLGRDSSVVQPRKKRTKLSHKRLRGT